MLAQRWPIAQLLALLGRALTMLVGHDVANACDEANHILDIALLTSASVWWRTNHPEQADTPLLPGEVKMTAGYSGRNMPNWLKIVLAQHWCQHVLKPSPPIRIASFSPALGPWLTVGEWPWNMFPHSKVAIAYGGGPSHFSPWIRHPEVYARSFWLYKPQGLCGKLNAVLLAFW